MSILVILGFQIEANGFFVRFVPLCGGVFRSRSRFVERVPVPSKPVPVVEIVIVHDSVSVCLFDCLLFFIPYGTVETNLKKL